jgi:hypothetical protein
MICYLLSGCKDKSNPSSTNDTGQGTNHPITKSSKRGIAFDLTGTSDFDSLSIGVSWWYNWNYTTSAPTNYYKSYQMEFIPMLWGGNPSGSDIVAVKSFILAHTEVQYLLVMNEPNLIDQSNQTPLQAATDWLTYEKIITDLATQGRTVYLVGPAMTWGTMTDYWDPVVWLDAFYGAYQNANGGRDPKIDFLAFHWYDYGLDGQLDRLKKYGKKIWVTEMANWNSQINSYVKQETQMQEMVNSCETRADVFRYAWFYGRGTYPDSKFTFLLDQSPGTLTELGKLYISLPFAN